MRLRVAVLAAVAVLVVALAPLAGANHTFAATATATGFDLRVAEMGRLSLGFADARVASTPVMGCPPGTLSCATGGGLVLTGQTATATRPGDMGPNSTTPTTTGGTPLGDAALVTVGAGTAQVTAPPGPIARADGSAATIDVTATQTLVETVPAVDDAIQTGLETIDTILGPVQDADPTGVVERVNESVDALIGDLAGAPIATVFVGQSRAFVMDDETVTSAVAAGGGATLVLAPTPGNTAAVPEGLVIVELGAATATATTNQRQATAESLSALVRIRVLDPTTGTFNDVVLPAGVDRMCLSDTPAGPVAAVFDVCVIAGGGQTTMTGSAAAARSAGASVEAFVMGTELLALNLADAIVGVNAVPPAQVPTPPPSASPSPSAVASPSASPPATPTMTIAPATITAQTVTAVQATPSTPSPVPAAPPARTTPTAALPQTGGGWFVGPVAALLGIGAGAAALRRPPRGRSRGRGGIRTRA